MFSICIPNYNYEKYIGLTLESIFNQKLKEFEVAVADNCSTDSSVDIVTFYKNKFPDQVLYKVNSVNLGFSANLDQAASLASNPYIIMLSSDDTIHPDALSTYKQILDTIESPHSIIICSANDVIDSKGSVIRSPRARDFRFNLWRKEDLDEEFSKMMGMDIYRVSASELLRRSLLTCSNPFNFLATMYSKVLYSKVGGYGGGRLINPDKWFHWRILSKADDVFFIDRPLFQYRWHGQNQTAQQANTGYLKFLLDEYRNTIEITEEMQRVANVTRKEFILAFIQRDIYRHGVGEYAKGRWLKSLRIYFFGLSTYPGDMILHPLFIIYSLMLLTTPLGSWVVSRFKP